MRPNRQTNPAKSITYLLHTLKCTTVVAFFFFKFGYVYFCQKLPLTSTQFGDKMRLESVKGCQYVLNQSWTSVLATFLELKLLS